MIYMYKCIYINESINMSLPVHSDDKHELPRVIASV